MSNQIDFLMEEYKRLGVSEAEAASAIKNLLGTTMARNEQARSERFSPGVTGFLGAASGFLRPGTNAADGYQKAMDAYQTRQETDPFVDQKMIGDYLNTDRKEINDLRAKVLDQMKAKTDADGKPKRQMVGSADQGWWAYNFDTEEKKLLVPGTLQQKQAAQLREVILNRLKEDGGDMTTHAKNADQLAQQIIYKYTPEEVEQYISQGGIPGAITKGVVTVPDKPAADITNGGVPYNKQGKLAEIAAAEDPEGRLSVGQPPAHQSQEQLANKIASAMGVQKPVVKTEVGPLVVDTPAQKEFKTTGATNWQNKIKELEEQTIANDKKVGHFDRLESMLMSGNTPSGPLNPYLEVIGSFASTYDPKGTLAQKYGNNAPAYFGELMNLVRADIKALGAGTAVSNLDLIVSQMAAGDLRNSPQGNLRLIGLQKYAAMEKAAHDRKYAKHIQDKQEGTSFFTSEKLPPEYALRRKPNAKGLEQYVVIPRSQYEKEFEAAAIKNGWKNKKPSQSQWEDYSKKSVEMMFSGEDYVKQ